MSVRGSLPLPVAKTKISGKPKSNKPPDDPFSYHPIWLMDIIGKVFKRIICGRFKQYTEGCCGLSESQFGFLKARSTIDVIEKVVNTAHEAINGKKWRWGSKKYCVIFTLDVKCIRLSKVMYHNGGSEQDRHTKLYSESNSKLLKKKDLSCTPQMTANKFTKLPLVFHRVVLRHRNNMWNIIYDKVIRFPILDSTKITGFTDDLPGFLMGRPWRR